MPYNVICFVCTVIAIGFGSIFNLTTRKLVPDTEENKSGILSRLTGFLRKGTKKGQEDSIDSKEETDTNVEQSIENQ